MRELPALFDSDMTKAILEDRKNQTRRPVNPQPEYVHRNAKTNYNLLNSHDNIAVVEYSPIHFSQWPEDAFVYHKDGNAGILTNPLGSVGDLLYCRETWKIFPFSSGNAAFEYRADCPNERVNRRIIKMPEDSKFDWLSDNDFWKWRPSMHMPKWAARTWLRVTGVGVERVQSISYDDAKSEGFADRATWKVRPESWEYANLTDMNHQVRSTPQAAFSLLWDATYSKPIPRKRKGKIAFYESYPWAEGTETREHKGLPWYVRGNPYVFATKFERIIR